MNEVHFNGVAFRSLAEQLGCSPMAPCRYLKSKQSIFAAVRGRAYARFGNAQQATADSDEDLRSRFADLRRAERRA